MHRNFAAKSITLLYMLYSNFTTLEIKLQGGLKNITHFACVPDGL